MIEDTWQFLVYMVLATTTVLWIIVLFGCAKILHHQSKAIGKLMGSTQDKICLKELRYIKYTMH